MNSTKIFTLTKNAVHVRYGSYGKLPLTNNNGCMDNRWRYLNLKEAQQLPYFTMNSLITIVRKTNG